MSHHTITTKFGPVQVHLHRSELGWLPVVVGHHAVPFVPEVDPCTAQCEQSALALLAEAIERLESSY